MTNRDNFDLDRVHFPRHIAFTGAVNIPGQHHRSPKMAKLKNPRVGPRMAQLVADVEANPGHVAIYYVRRVAPHGTGIGYGYRTLHRAAKAGLITLNTWSKRAGCYSVHPVSK